MSLPTRRHTRWRRVSFTPCAKPNLRGLPARRLDKKGTTVITDELMAYDQDANPVCVRDSTTGNPGSRDFSYDARNRLIKASAPNQGWVSSEYQYDSQDNIKMARLGTRQYNYSYNTKNQLADIGQPATAPVATNFGLLSCADYSLLSDLGSGGGGATITISPSTLPDAEVDFDYSQTLTSTGGTGPYIYALTAGSLPLGLSLSGAVISGSSVRAETKTVSIRSTDSDGSSGTRNYTLTTVNRGGGGPLFAAPMLLAGDTLKYDFTYDAQGRMLKKGAQQNYVYDALNRMTQVTGKESYLYDAHGRRVQITKTSDSKINYPLYSLDGKLLVEDNRQTLVRSEYIYAGGRLVAKKIQPITSTGTNNGTATITTIHTDFLGSPVAETNSAGTVTRVERYTPYGEPSDLQLDVGPGFTGHATDVATGLTYMQQRYYDQELGRFLTPDAVQTDPNSGASFNRYWYADNNPIANIDPDGRCTGTLIKANCGASGDVVTGFAGAMYQGSAGSGDLPSIPENSEPPAQERILDGLVGDLQRAWDNLDIERELSAIPGEGVLVGGTTSVLATLKIITIGNKEFRMADSAAKHALDIVGNKNSEYFGELARPFYKSQLLVKEIMAAAKPVKEASGALRWHVPGTFRKSEGTWELVMDPNKLTIFHFNFVTK